MGERIITADEARALREAATPGPWTSTGPHFGFHVVQHGPGHAGSICGFPANASYNSHNAALIAGAPDLAWTVEQVTAERDAARFVLQRLAFMADDAAAHEMQGSASDVLQIVAETLGCSVWDLGDALRTLCGVSDG